MVLFGVSDPWVYAMLKQYKYNDVFIFEPQTFRIILAEKEIKLSHKESAVLAMLCENAMRVVERKTLLADIWDDVENSDVSLNKSILFLRRKFESIGLDKAIDTIPRVGYTLRLAVETTHSTDLSTQESVHEDNEKTDDVEKPGLQVMPKSSRVKTGIIIASAILLTLLLSTLAYRFYSPETTANDNSAKNPLSLSKSGNSTNGRSLLYTNDVVAPDAYVKFIDLIKPEKRFYALVSKSALSYIDINKGTNWQLTFLLDNKADINAQLACAANYINSYQPTPLSMDNLPGMFFVRLRFYRVCTTTPDYIGEMVIKTTRPLEEDRESLTLTQDFTFTGYTGKVIFHLKRISRAYTQGNDAVYLSVKSIGVQSVNQEILQTDNNTNQVFNQFTQDDIYQVTVDKEHGIFASTPFGGLLYYVKKYQQTTADE